MLRHRISKLTQNSQPIKIVQKNNQKNLLGPLKLNYQSDQVAEAIKKVFEVTTFRL